MADGTKKASINGGLISEIKTLFSLSKSKKTLKFAYGFMLALVIFTVFVAFSPSSNSSSPVFSNIFSASSSSNSSSSIFSQQSYRSHFSSIFSYFFPNSSQIAPDFEHNYSISPQNSSNVTVSVKNETQNRVLDHQIGAIEQNQSTIQGPNPAIEQNQSTIQGPNPAIKQNQSTIQGPNPAIEQNQSTIQGPNPAIEQNQSTISVPKTPISSNSTATSSPKSYPIAKNSTENRTATKITHKGVGVISNLTSSMLKKQSNGSSLGASVRERSEDLVKGLMNCDLFDGEWIRDDSYPLYKPGSCSLIDEQFDCFLNGRPDNGYHKLKWKPKGCSIPRLNGTLMLEMLRGKRLVFVGDSLNRNMWESLVCILRNSAKDRSKVYEASGRHHFRTEPSYSFVFKDYGCTVEFFVSPFLVQEWEMDNKSGSKKETLRLDLVSRSADQYKTADILVFNTGHWWTHDKTAKGKDYYQEGSHVYHDLNVSEAFRKALTTWGRWVDVHVNPKKSLVFFRGYSASHFSGGQWNSGGQCDHETEPIKNTTYLAHYPPKMAVLEKVLKNMKTHVSYLNITRLTDYRKDGHPSIYRKRSFTKEELKSPLSFQDCSHWCLPGVPDAWNELLYAELLVNKAKNKQN